jgi:hypothetical protein
VRGCRRCGYGCARHPPSEPWFLRDGGFPYHHWVLPMSLYLSVHMARCSHRPAFAGMPCGKTTGETFLGSDAVNTMGSRGPSWTTQGHSAHITPIGVPAAVEAYYPVIPFTKARMKSVASRAGRLTWLEYMSCCAAV